jgi:hypothetical protein
MIDPSAALQTALRGLFIGTPALTALVPAGSILDRHARPETFPCVLLGQDQVIADNSLVVYQCQIFATLHVWTKEPSFALCKQIAGEIRTALVLSLDVTPYALLRLEFSEARYLRDPGGEHSHGVVTIDAFLREQSL